MAMLQVIIKLYYHQSEEELDHTIDQFFIEHYTLCSRIGSFQTSYILTSSSIKYGKIYLWHNLYANVSVLGEALSDPLPTSLKSHRDQKNR